MSKEAPAQDPILVLDFQTTREGSSFATGVAPSFPRELRTSLNKAYGSNPHHRGAEGLDPASVADLCTKLFALSTTSGMSLLVEQLRQDDPDMNPMVMVHAAVLTTLSTNVCAMQEAMIHQFTPLSIEYMMRVSKFLSNVVSHRFARSSMEHIRTAMYGKSHAEVDDLTDVYNRVTEAINDSSNAAESHMTGEYGDDLAAYYNAASAARQKLAEAKVFVLARAGAMPKDMETALVSIVDHLTQLQAETSVILRVQISAAAREKKAEEAS